MRARADHLAPPVLVVGVGNRDRGEDAVGPIVVDALVRSAPGEFETLIVHDDMTDLVMRWGERTDVVVVDAMVSGREPGTIVCVDGLTESLPTSDVVVSTHGIGLPETIELAHHLDRLPHSLTLYAIEISTTGYGEGLSHEVSSAVTAVVEDIISIDLH